jgi:hypothetical protein
MVFRAAPTRTARKSRFRVGRLAPRAHGHSHTITKQSAVPAVFRPRFDGGRC